MDSALVSSLSGALAQNRRVEIIANNLANADTPAFKTDDIAFQEALQGANRTDLRSDIPERPYKESELLSKSGNESRAVLYGAEFTDLRSGSYKQTSNPLDVAIEGNGFLEVLTPDGVRLTRAGNLALDPGGRLMTQDGFLVLGPGQSTGAADAALRAITVGKSGITIDSEGNIYGNNDRGNANLGKLSIVQVANPAALKKEGRNLFEAPPEAAARPFGAAAPAPIAAAPATTGASDPASAQAVQSRANPMGAFGLAPRVHQGMLESSNVNPVLEMTKLIEAHRLFDQNTRIMQNVGDMNSRASEIGKF